MSGLSEASTPAHDNANAQQNVVDAAQLQQQLDHPQGGQQPPITPGGDAPNGKGKRRRTSPIPRIRRACTKCHACKTRCSETLPCENCTKRGLESECTYADPEFEGAAQPQPPASAPVPAQYMPPTFSQMPPLPAQYYYDYSASTSTFRPAKRPRPLTEDEAAAVTRNFQRGDFYVGNSGPVRIDPRLPVRLTLGEGDHVHFTISEAI